MLGGVVEVVRRREVLMSVLGVTEGHQSRRIFRLYRLVFLEY